jgi:putative phosphoribosyl transferase
VRAARVLREGSASVEIVAIVEENGLDFVVLGTHGHRGVTRLLLGSVAERVVHLSHVPVLTVPSWRYADRAAAGRELAARLRELRGQRPLVFATSRAAIPIAHEVAHALDAPLEVLVVRQIECDGQPIGAVGEERTVVLDDPLVSRLAIRAEALNGIVHEARRLSKAESVGFRGARWIGDVTDRTVIVLGDAAATQWPTVAAAKVLRDAGARRVVAAYPAIHRRAAEAIARHVDEVVSTEQVVDGASLQCLYRKSREPSDRDALDLLSTPATRSSFGDRHRS